MISRRLIPSRGRKFSPAVPTITAECLSPLPLRKRRAAATAADFLEHIRAGDCTVHGAGRHAAGFFRTVFTTRSPVSSRIGSPKISGRPRRCCDRCFRGSWRDRIRRNSRYAKKRPLSRKALCPEKFSSWPSRPTFRSGKNSPAHFARPEVKRNLAREMEGVTEPERRTFLMANLVCEQLAFRLFEKFIQQIRTGNIVESMQALSGIAPILVILAPYIYGFHSQAPSRRWLREICRDLIGQIPPQLQNRKRAWFTDTLEDVNGVATTIRKMARERRGRRRRTDRRHVAQGFTDRRHPDRRTSGRSANSNCRNTNCKSSASRRSCRFSITSSANNSPKSSSARRARSVSAVYSRRRCSICRRAGFITPIFRNTSAS